MGSGMSIDLTRITHEHFCCNRDTKIETYCGILSSRQDHIKGARPRKRGGDAPDGERARRSVGQHTVGDWLCRLRQCLSRFPSD